MHFLRINILFTSIIAGIPNFNDCKASIILFTEGNILKTDTVNKPKKGKNPEVNFH